MLSKEKIKFIKSLEKKKIRLESSCFLAEGNKLVSDILPYFDCELLIAKASWLATQDDVKAKELLIVDGDDIDRTSLLKNPQDVIAVFRQPDYFLNKEELKTGLTLVLDGIQNPGNFGTIIRLANWFGISTVICSPDTVDVYNPKTIQATMGALAHVKIFYTSLPELLEELKEVPIYGAFLDGLTLYEQNLSSNGLIVMGNEGNGISAELKSKINNRLYIPNYPLGAESTESLNVAVATAIICSEFRRQQVYSI